MTGAGGPGSGDIPEEVQSATSGPPSVGPVEEPPSPGEPAGEEERSEASRELQALADGWSERERGFDPHAAGGVRTEQSSLFKDAVRRFMKNKLALGAATLLWIFTLLSILAPLPAFHLTDDPNAVDYEKRLVPAFRDSEHPFGTTDEGRDMWHRAWKGGRISLAIGFSVALVILLVGLVYGSIAGYAGGRVDNIMMRFLDAMYGLPYLPFAILAVFLIKEHFPGASSLAYMVPALSIVTWFTAARIIRAQVMSLKENEYVEAARSAGANSGRIVFRHIVPNTFGVLVIAVFLEVPNAILGEAILSFLGLGVEFPEPSWGQMAYNGYRYFRVSPHMIYVPGALIAITVLCTVAIADGLRDALDPRGRKN